MQQSIRESLNQEEPSRDVWLRAWSQDPGIKSHIRFLTGSLPLCLSLFFFVLRDMSSLAVLYGTTSSISQHTSFIHITIYCLPRLWSHWHALKMSLNWFNQALRLAKHTKKYSSQIAYKPYGGTVGVCIKTVSTIYYSISGTPFMNDVSWNFSYWSCKIQGFFFSTLQMRKLEFRASCFKYKLKTDLEQIPVKSDTAAHTGCMMPWSQKCAKPCS